MTLAYGSSATATDVDSGVSVVLEAFPSAAKAIMPKFAEVQC